MINTVKENKLITNNYVEDELTLLSTIVYSDIENINHGEVEKFIKHTKPEMFFNKQARELYGIFKDLYEANSAILGTKQFISLFKKMVSIEYPELENFVEYDFESFWSSFVTLNYWLDKLHKFYFKERYKNAATKEECESVIQEEISLTKSVQLTDIADDAKEILSRYEEAAIKAIYTPYKKVNNLIGSLQGGDMIILAASTGCGKTCFMLNFAKETAKAGKKVLIFSLEMPKKQLQQRVICSEAGIDASKFRNFSLSLEDKLKFMSYVEGNFKDLKMNIYGKQTVSMNEIRYMVLFSKPDIVFIDYLGLINSYDGKNTYEKFSNISRDIKLLAMEANIPIVALHQLNRNFQQRENKRPIIADLRDSGKIEQDADMIWFLYRPSLFETNVPEDDIYFMLAKDRHGDSNREAKLKFNGKYQRIYEE